MTDKLSGAGRKAIAAILANADGPVRINDILTNPEPFWQKMGAGYRITMENSTADWATYRAQGKNARRGEGAGPREMAKNWKPDDRQLANMKAAREASLSQQEGPPEKPEA